MTLVLLAGCTKAPPAKAPPAGAPLAGAPAPAAPQTGREASPDPQQPNAAWERIKRALVGSWQAKTPKGAVITESFQLISSESALVEDYTSANGRKTSTVYHPDRGTLLLTHYCAQGNQPRLRAIDVDAAGGAVSFRFVDATNLLEGQAVLIEKEFRFKHNGFEQTEVYKQPDGSLEKTTLFFSPAEAPGVARLGLF